MKGNPLSKIYVVVFLIIFFAIAGFMVKGLLTQQKENNADRTKYEQMIKSDGKTTLTQEILDQDHNEYVESVKSNNKTFAIIGIGFLGLMLLFLIIAIANYFSQRNKGAQGIELVRNIVSIVAISVFLVMGIIIGVAFIRPMMNKTDYDKESYKYVELNIVDTKVEEHKSTHRKSNGHGTTTTTTYTYYVITEDNEELKVGKLLYERVANPGVYYAGMTEGGNIFSLYPSEYFELG